jgi:hypothetical protein
MNRARVAASAVLVVLAGCSGSDDAPASGSGGRGGAAGEEAGADTGTDASDGREESWPGDAPSSDADGGARGEQEDGPRFDAFVEERTDEGGDAASDVDLDSKGNVMPPSPPATLMASGLFTGLNANGTLVLATGVEPFTPKYALWSDGADKSRWVYLPPGAKIDTSDPDHWSVPVGTKFWKEFAVQGKRVETRLIWRFGPGPDDFLYAAYWWKPGDAGTATNAALADPDVGVPSANGTTHDIPPRKDCVTCHGSLMEHVLGFGALELAHTMSGVTTTTLTQGGRLTQPLPSNLEFPGPDAATRDVLGYLHANCGNCHNTTPGVFMIPEPRMDLRVRVGQTLDQTGAYRTAVNVEVTKFYHPTAPTIKYRIAGGDPTRSCVSFRMADLAKDNRMPPIATKVVDTQGLAAVNAWIATLPAPPP